jgi:hypothetical protein
MRKYEAFLTISAGFALLPMVARQKNCFGERTLMLCFEGTL